MADSLLMPFLRHPAFFWLRPKIDLLQWHKSGIIRFIDIMVQGKLVSLDHLTSKIPGVTSQQYDQMQAIANDLLMRQYLRKDITRLEKQLYSQGDFQKALSKVYNLIALNTTVADLSRDKWQIETQTEISQQEWHVTHRYMKLISFNVSLRENFYELHHHWYLTPCRIHKMIPRVLSYCWRCQMGIGSTMHTWWSFPKVN